jgi:hypothetical protein
MCRSIIKPRLSANKNPTDFPKPDHFTRSGFFFAIDIQAAIQLLPEPY